MGLKDLFKSRKNIPVAGDRLVEHSFDKPGENKDIFVAPSMAFKLDSDEARKFIGDYVQNDEFKTQFSIDHGLIVYDYILRSQYEQDLHKYIVQDKSGDCCYIDANQLSGYTAMRAPSGDNIAYNGLLFSPEKKDDYKAMQSYLEGKTKLADLPLRFFTDEYADIREAIVNQEKKELFYSSQKVGSKDADLAERAEYLDNLLAHIISEAKDMEEKLNSIQQKQ